MPSNGSSRLPNKVQWCLQDIIAAARRAQRQLGNVAARTTDETALVTMIHLAHDLAEIQMHAVNARHNEYLEHPLETEEPSE